LEIKKMTDEWTVMVHYPLDLCLLEHKFRDQDMVRISSVPPREYLRMFAIMIVNGIPEYIVGPLFTSLE
jgi:hypothetical protein